MNTMEGTMIDKMDEIEETGEEKAHGLTFAEWLSAAGRSDSASEYDLRAAWRSGEDPAEYTGCRATDTAQ